MTSEELTAQIKAVEAAEARREALLPVAREIFLAHVKAALPCPPDALRALWASAVDAAEVYVAGEIAPKEKP